MATKRKPAVHPQQPVVLAKDGIYRFKQNRIVDYLVRWCAGHNGAMGYPKLSDRAPDLNEIARLGLAEGRFSRDEMRQLNQLVGYSVSGCPLLTNREYDDAQKQADAIERHQRALRRRRKAKR